MKKAVVIATILFFNCNLLAYHGGDGSSTNPYRIADVADFLQLSNTPTDWSKNFILIANINLNGRTFTQSPIAPNINDAEDKSVFKGTYFTGSFDGKGYAISNLTITAPEIYHIGLFGYVRGAQISNLGLTNIKITGYQYVGGLVGYNDGGIVSCYTIGLVKGNRCVGGLVGEGWGGTIISSYSNSSVSGGTAGGLVGNNHSQKIQSCYATGSVNGWDCGGLVGRNGYGCELSYCYATSSVSGTVTGGLVGNSYNGYNKINSCFWDIETTTQSVSMGGKGLTTSQMKSMAIYQNAGWAKQGWTINDGTGYPRLSWENVGGEPIPPAIIPFPGSGTATEPYLIYSAQDFALLSWYHGVLNKYIMLAANLDLNDISICPIGDLGPFIGTFDGSGYTINNATINQPASSFIGLFNNVYPGGKIRNLNVKNINITGYRFVGGLIGYNKSGIITSCSVDGNVNGLENYVDVGGLVGNNDTGAINLCCTSGSVNGKGSNVGGLIGYNRTGAITSCYTTNIVNSNMSAGGLVGYNESGVITSCYTTGTISGKWGVGGLVGQNKSGTITSCYDTATINATGDCVGGLIGSDTSGKIKTSYASGSINGTGYYIGGLVGIQSGITITDSFWDLWTTGQTVGVGSDTIPGATGKTTVEMQTASTFTSVGWDTVNTWWITDGNYPQLISLPGPFTLTIQTEPSFITSISPPLGQITIPGTVSVNARKFIQCPNVYEFDHWEGDVDNPNLPITTVAMNQDKTITAVFRDGSLCGDECHPYPTMDFSRDCRVDLADFALFATQWMECTAPDCG